MNILTPEFLAIIGVGLTIVAVGAALSTQLFFTTRRIDAYRADASEDRRAFQAEAAADRRAFDARMEEFRREMGEFRREVLRLSERQSRLEGMQESQASGTSRGS